MEQNEEWQLQHRYLRQHTMTEKRRVERITGLVLTAG
jgi:hypothetical protein